MIPNRFTPRPKMNTQELKTVVELPGLTPGRTLATHAMTGNGIGWAVKQMWGQSAVRRTGWNGKGMYCKLQLPDVDSANTLPYVWIRTADGHRVPWLCSQTDLLAMDWELAE